MQGDSKRPRLMTGVVNWALGRRHAGTEHSIGAAEQLAELGATIGPALASAPVGPAECFRAALKSPPPGSAMVGAAARIAVLRDGITVRLKGPAGTLLDHLYCPPRAAPYNVAVFAPAGQPVTWHIGHITPQSAADIEAAVNFSFSRESLAPARLMARVDLEATSIWPEDQFAEPATEDTAGRLRDVVFRDLTEALPVPWLDGSQVWLEPGDEQSHCLFKYGVYEAESLFAARSLLPPGGVFVDAGANSGLYTVFASALLGPSGRIIAIEPSAREFGRLEANVALNRIANIRLVRAALAEAAGEVALRVAEPHFSGHNTLAPHFAYDPVNLQSVETVPAITLDSLMAGERRCDLVKMDIEGAEMRALQGAVRVLETLRPALLLELNEPALRGNGTSPTLLAKWLLSRRYVLHSIDVRTGNRVPFAPPVAGQLCNIVALPQQ